MMKGILFALVMTLSDGNVYVLDHGLTAEDCADMARQFPIAAFTVGSVAVTCEREREDSDSVD